MAVKKGRTKQKPKILTSTATKASLVEKEKRKAAKVSKTKNSVEIKKAKSTKLR